MFLSRLDVVNEMLACVGELPMNSLDEGHPLTAPATRSLDIANTREQTKGWWFNREITDLFPDTDGFIPLPLDTLQVDPVDQSKNFVQRGRRLYKPNEPSSAKKFIFDRKVRVRLTRQVPFEELPSAIQMLVSYSAQLDFMKSYEADAQKFQQVQMLYLDSLKSARSEDIRAYGGTAFSRRPLQHSPSEIGGNWPGNDYWPHP